MGTTPETNNKLMFLPIRLCFINVYPNPNPTPYSNANRGELRVIGTVFEFPPCARFLAIN